MNKNPSSYTTAELIKYAIDYSNNGLAILIAERFDKNIRDVEALEEACNKEVLELELECERLQDQIEAVKKAAKELFYV